MTTRQQSEDPAGEDGPAVAGAATAPLYHAAAVHAFHIGEDSVTLTLASPLPTDEAGRRRLRAELHLNVGARDFERFLRRLIEVRADMVKAGVIPAPWRDGEGGLS